ncbi:MAG: RNA repair domain-containing protein [Pyrobaculum sp.]
MRQIFNKLKWTGQKGHFWYINRGSASGEEMASTEALLEIGPDGVVIATTHGERYVPYHRIVEIRLDTGEVILDRRKRR